jgi:hypothetical protein
MVTALITFLVNSNPGSFTLPQRQESATNPNHERITERCGVRHNHFLSGSEAEIEQAAAILGWAVQPLDTKPSIPGDLGQIPGLHCCQMKTIIIFNYHALNMPDRRFLFKKYSFPVDTCLAQAWGILFRCILIWLFQQTPKC